MSTYQKGQAAWTWRVDWTENLKLTTKVVHGTIRQVDDDIIQLLPDGVRADQGRILRCVDKDVYSTKSDAYKGLLDWLHAEFKERADTMHDLQREICSIAAAQAVNQDRLAWSNKKQKKG